MPCLTKRQIQRNMRLARLNLKSKLNIFQKKGLRAYLSADFFETGKSVKSKKDAIVVTFDDGNYSDYSIAFPILKNTGLALFSL